MSYPDPLTAATAFNACWTDLERSDPTPASARRMLNLAHASRSLWQSQGGAREWALGDWQISRCYAVMGEPKLALLYAQSALDLAQSLPQDGFLSATCHEAMARALRLTLNEAAHADHHAGIALRLAQALTDTEDRDVVLADLAEHSQQACCRTAAFSRMPHRTP